MSDFSSIDDIKNNSDDHDDKVNDSKNIKVASDEVQEEFENKMNSLKEKETEREVKRYAKKVGFPHIDLTDFPVSQDALQLVPEKKAKELEATCFFYQSDEIRIAATDPTKEEVQNLKEKLEKKTGASGKIYTISQRSFDYVLKRYDRMPTVEPVRKGVEIKQEDLDCVKNEVDDFSSVKKLLKEGNTTQLVAYILGSGLKLGASDVHIEAEEDDVKVRLRIDGILHNVATLSRKEYEKIVSRIKLVASLKLNITDEPQDGRFGINFDGGEVDVRVSTIPTVHGESIVMRLLEQDREGFSLDELGLHEKSFKMLKEQIERPNGMIITTGPTGSGKTTTLYAIMNILNQSEVKILTLENPVEYKMEGVNQSQVGEDYSFAEGLESMLRQDPDIAMVGEIRNIETAEIAIQASLTGHLMLSTIHTNSAAGAIPRFLSMGAKPFLLAPALNCVIGQRLVRVLCDSCKQETELSGRTKERVEEQIERMPSDIKEEAENKSGQFYTAGEGCDECNDVGYDGRVGIYEIFVIDSEFEDMILGGSVAAHKVEEKAIEKGMMTMVQDGILKALDGMTSAEEVFRVIE